MHAHFLFAEEGFSSIRVHYIWAIVKGLGEFILSLALIIDYQFNFEINNFSTVR